MFAGLFTINLLFYTTNFVGCLFLLAQGQKVDKKKLLGILFFVNNLPDQISPCSYYMNLPLLLALQGRLHTGQPFF